MASACQRCAPGEAGLCTQFALDADDLIVFGQSVGTGKRTGLDLPAVSGDREIGYGGVLCLAGAV